ncbi:hypothetical protein ZWY2020_049600 [Hordeum vulgare]|nr:hypothetical protein ZWY2020_049600 [Hordeum vulgare]
MDNHDAPKRKRGRKPKPPAAATATATATDNGNHDSAPSPKPKRGRKPKPPAAASPDNDHPSSPLAAAADTPEPGSSSGPRGRRKSRRGRHELPSDADAALRAPPSPTRRGAPKGAANMKVEVPAVEPLRWEQVAKVMPSMDAVVKVFCVHTEPNFSMPWQRKKQYSSSSSGFIIGGRRVLTNAHSVEHYTQVKLKKRGSDTKYLATVLAIGNECDIAMLTVDDDEFWKGVLSLSLDCCQHYRMLIEILSYVHGSTELLGLQIDAAINSGNSGGPAFNDQGKCVGIAFQSLKHEDAENIGYVIPTPVIKHFIQDYEKSGEYTGFPILGIEWQKMENPDLRKAMGMKSDQKGVRIRRIEPTAPESGCMQPSDIILSFDGIEIANDGTGMESDYFSYLVSQKYTGEKARVKVLRSSKIHEFNIKLSIHKKLIPAHIKGRPPSYYIVAGFVFMVVSVPYLRSEYGKDYEFDAPVKLLDKHLHAMAQSPDEQLVVVSQVLVADINIGYEEIVNTQVRAFNGKPVNNLKQLATMVEDCNKEFLKFDMDYDQVVVLETKTARAATQDILTTHCIPSAMSDDLKA